MPVISRRRTVPATPERLWTVLADPEQLPTWWPHVERVEDASRGGWTSVLSSPKAGKTLRADYTLVDSAHPRRLSWRQEVEESPFERLFTSAVTEVELESAGPEGTHVKLTARVRLRGFARLGGFQVARATRRQLTGALEGLNALAESWKAA
jgi:uncharacterized protein YndB with AHSA1/START domain